MEKRFLSFLIQIVLLGLICSCSEESTNGPPPELTFTEKLQAALDDGIKKYNGNGISAAVIMPDGETWVGASGISRSTTPVATNTLFSAGSITKMFTAATILQLAEEGKLTLEDSLHEWVPSYPNIDSTITIRQLLNHTSGLFNITENPSLWQAIFADPGKSWTLEESVANYTLAPYFPIGTDWHYSNTGYLLLRIIIRQASGSQISTEYRNRFFTPFDLERTFLAPEETLPVNTAQGWFDLDGNGIYDELPFMTSFYSMAGGGVFCTAEDLAKWARALLHERIVLDQQSLDQMLTFHSPCPGEPLVSSYGLGLINFSPDLFNNLEMWGHGGDAPGYAAGCFYLPDYGVCIGIMDNTEEGEAMWTINDLLTVITEHLRNTR